MQSSTFLTAYIQGALRQGKEAGENPESTIDRILEHTIASLRLELRARKHGSIADSIPRHLEQYLERVALLPARRPMGLPNAFQQCYQNCILQSLGATLGGKNLLKKLGHQHFGKPMMEPKQPFFGIQDDRRRKRERWLQEHSEGTHPSASIMRVLQNLHGTEDPHVRPEVFQKQMFRYQFAKLPDLIEQGQDWADTEQQVAREYLELLLSCFSQGNQFQGTQDREMYNPAISNLLWTRSRYRLTCKQCGNPRVLTESSDWYFDLSLPENVLQDGQPVSLRTMLPSSEDIEVRCEACKIGERAKKEWIGLQDPPEILTLEFATSNALGARVFYNVELDETLPRRMVDFDEKTCNAGDYQLAAIVKHIAGFEETGHYIAYINSQQGWFKADDDIVTGTTLASILSEDTELHGMITLAFYQRLPQEM